MIRLLIDLSRYIFIFNISIFVLIGFVMLFKKEEKRSGFFLFVQAFLIFVNHITGAFVLMASRNSLNYLVLPIIQIIILISFVVLMQAVFLDASRLLTNDLTMLLSIGLLILTRLYYERSIKQLVFISIGFVLIFFIPLIIKHKNILAKFPLIYIAFGALLLASVLIQKKVVNGSMLNLSIFGFTFQPSEFVKLLFVIGLAGILLKCNKLYEYLLTILMALAYVGILFYSRDLGTAAIFYIAFVVMLFVASKSYIYLLSTICLALAGSVLAYYRFSHVRTRFELWLNPWKDIDGKGYQTTQSLFAICSGNFWGFGLDGGAPTTIPYVDQDFVFSAICEEFGAIFGFFVILLCINYFLELIKIAKSNDDDFYQLCGIGLAFIYMAQIILTIGGNINFIPMTGVTLNYISYGGSSILSSLFLFGIAQGIAICRHEHHEEEVKSKLHLNISQIAFSLVSASMAVYLLMFVYNERDVLVSNNYNAKRKEIIANNIERGDIYSSDGEVLAYSKTINNETRRFYPFNETYSHVVGYDTLGGLGVEKDCDTILMTSNIAVEEWVEDDLNNKKHKGNSVTITINSKLQEAATRVLGIYDGAIIAIDPTTGEILAMVSKPDFDPNLINDEWEELINDNQDSRLVNRVTSGLYPPGSTFKIFTALEYIKENEDTSNYHFNCNGKYTYDDSTIRCYHGTNHGSINFINSFAKSCNTSFANIGLSLDFKDFTKTLNSLYFNKSLGLEFQTKQSSFSDEVSTHNIMQTSIGQGETLITPIHLAMMTSAIANEGKLYKPFLIASIDSADDNNIKAVTQGASTQLISSSQANNLKELMIEVVESGTGTRLKDQEVKVAGKTGSAEYINGSSQSHAWFTCFTYDTENPIVLTIIVEGAGSGGEYAVPMARQLLDIYYKQIIQ